MLFYTIIVCIRRVVVVAFDEKLIVYDACRFRERFTITGLVLQSLCFDGFWLTVIVLVLIAAYNIIFHELGFIDIY